MRIRMKHYPEWQGAKYLKIANFHWHSLCDKHYSKHLTFMKSFNPVRSVTIIVPMRHREKYIFHCHTTSVEKPGIWTLAFWLQTLCTLLQYYYFVLRGLDPHTTEYFYLVGERAFLALRGAAFLWAKVFSIFYLLLTLLGQSSGMCMCVSPAPQPFCQEASCSSVQLEFTSLWENPALYFDFPTAELQSWQSACRLCLCIPWKKLGNSIFFFLLPYISSDLSALGSSMNGLLPFQLWSHPTEQKY